MIGRTGVQTYGSTGVRADGRTRGSLAAIGLAVALLLAWVIPSAAQETSLTIYQDGRVMVRRTLPIAVPRGTSTASLDLGGRGADATSLVALDEGVQVRGVQVWAATGVEGSLRRALGREIDFALGNERVEVKSARGAHRRHEFSSSQLPPRAGLDLTVP